MDTQTQNLPSAREHRPVLLVVDDEEGPRQSLKIVFKQDYDVLLASSGEEALNIAARKPVDVAILDIMMGSMSGIDLLARLKELHPAVEVIMLTAFETLETARQALRHGACDYLNKPFDIATIRAAVTRALERHQVSVRLKNVNAELEALQNEIKDQRVREEMVRTKGDIYASVLHDINSPLTVISGFAEVINAALQDAASIEGEKLASMREDISHLNNQVTRCFEISRRYLSFLREGAETSPQVSIHQILTDLRELLLRHPSTSGNKLLINPFEATARINGTDLLQILLNITINALQCTEKPHQVEVTAALREKPLDPDLIPENDKERLINREGFQSEPPLVLINIRDTGPGIPPDVVERLFDHQITTKDPEKGTGLGLSIVYRLIRKAEGSIHVQTKRGTGSTFTVYLPADR